MVSPDDSEIEIQIFKNNFIKFYGKNGQETPEDEKLPEIIPVNILPGLEIDVNEIF